MNKEEFQTVLAKHIKHKYETQSEAARNWGVSRAFVSAVMLGKKNPNATMLADCGYEVASATYRKIKKSAPPSESEKP